MTRKKKAFLWVGIGAVALMLLCPPWIEVIRYQGAVALETPQGYAPVFNAPYQCRIDFGRLALQISVVVIIAGGLLLTYKD